MTNRELADIELDELVCESVPDYRDWFCHRRKRPVPALGAS
jgi:hypothetical protein